MQVTLVNTSKTRCPGAHYGIIITMTGVAIHSSISLSAHIITQFIKIVITHHTYVARNSQYYLFTLDKGVNLALYSISACLFN